MPVVNFSIAEHEYKNTEEAVKERLTVAGANTLGDLVKKSIAIIGSGCGSDSAIYNVKDLLNVEAGSYIKLMRGVYGIVSDTLLECPVKTFAVEVESWKGPQSLTIQPVICISTYPGI